MSSRSSKRNGPSRNPLGARERLSGPDGAPLIAIGDIVGVHGVRGEVRLRTYNARSSAPAEAEHLFIVEGTAMRTLDVEQARPHGRVWIVRFNGIDTPEQARMLAGAAAAVREADLPALEAGQFYCYQLIGLQVVDDGGGVLGRVADVLATGANDVLVVDAAGKELLIPMIDAIVAEVDSAAGRIVVRSVDGLLE